MEKYKKIWEAIEVASNHEVEKKSCISGIGIVFILFGVGCMVGAKGFEDPNSSLPAFLYTAAAILLLVGIVKVCLDRTCYVFKPTQSKLYSKTVYFDAKDETELKNSLEMNRFEVLKNLTPKKDGVIKLELMMSRDGQFAALQLFEYIPYNYITYTPVCCYYEEAAKELASYMKCQEAKQ